MMQCAPPLQVRFLIIAALRALDAVVKFTIIPADHAPALVAAEVIPNEHTHPHQLHIQAVEKKATVQSYE